MDPSTYATHPTGAAESPQERANGQACPMVSVVMPVRNEARHIAKTLEQLIQQQREGVDFEILVVDGCSTDGTPAIVSELARQHPEIRLLHNPRRLSSSARNIGITHARGEYVVVIDGHCEIRSRTYLQDLVSAFERHGADCLGRPQPLDVTNATPLQRAIAVARSSRLGHHPDSFIYSSHEQRVPASSVAVAYRRSVFERVGMFDESFDACEDYELNHRIDRTGLRCDLIPGLVVYYQPRQTLGGLFRQLARYGRGRVRLLRKHSDSFTLSSFLPAAFLLAVLAGALVAWWVPPFCPVYAGAALFYVFVLLVVSIGLAIHRRDARLLFWLPPVFATIHVGSGYGVLVELFAGRWLGWRRGVE